jgi:hypothetical protein
MQWRVFESHTGAAHKRCELHSLLTAEPSELQLARRGSHYSRRKAVTHCRYCAHHARGVPPLRQRNLFTKK